MFSENEKNEIKKACTGVVKESRGHGPRNIYVRFFDEEIIVVIEGMMSLYEKRLVTDLGNGAVELLSRNYEKNASTVAMERLNDLTGNKFGFKLKSFEYNMDDVENNKFTYVVSFNRKDVN